MRTGSRFAFVAALVGAMTLLAGCLKATVTDAQVVGPPDTGATAFGSAFSMDEGRLGARAMLGGAPVVYVFDADGAGWTHTATIAPPPGSTSAWGRSLAVSGDTIVIADPWRALPGIEEYGLVRIYDLRDGTWHAGQQLTAGTDWSNFGDGVWLTGSGLLVRSGIVCDATCGAGQWDLYQRYGGTFRQAFTSRPERTGYKLSVGVDQGRIAVGNPGFFDYDFSGGYDNGLMVLDANVRLPAILLDEIEPLGDPYEDEPVLVTDLYRTVDLSGDLLAYESCCASDQRLHIRRFDGVSYQPEATFDLTEQATWISVLPDLILVADAGDGVWHTFNRHDGEWTRSNDVPAPDPVAGGFATAPVAVGDRIAVRGDNVIHVLTLDVVDLGSSD